MLTKNKLTKNVIAPMLCSRVEETIIRTPCSSMQEAGWTIVDWALLSNGLTSIGLEHTASGITGALSVYPGADGSTIFGTWLLPG